MALTGRYLTRNCFCLDGLPALIGRPRKETPFLAEEGAMSVGESDSLRHQFPQLPLLCSFGNGSVLVNEGHDPMTILFANDLLVGNLEVICPFDLMELNPATGVLHLRVKPTSLFVQVEQLLFRIEEHELGAARLDVSDWETQITVLRWENTAESWEVIGSVHATDGHHATNRLEIETFGLEIAFVDSKQGDQMAASRIAGQKNLPPAPPYLPMLACVHATAFATS